MSLSEIKNLKIKLLIPLFIFVFGIAILTAITYMTFSTSDQRARTQTELNAISYGDQMIRYFTEGITVTDSLEQIIISENGTINKFDEIASDMMTSYIQSIQLAPDGVVTEIYPEEGNESGKIDLLHDEKRGAIARYGRDHDLTIAQGPFPLNQGGSGIAVRNPVYLTDENGQKYFWGFTIMILRTPDIFSNSVHALSNFGYDYRLSKTASPLSTEYEEIDSSGQELQEPVIYNFQLGGCEWKLEVMPSDGWHSGKNANLVFALGLFVILLVTGLSIALLILEGRGKALQELSITDALTGLLNRHGFDDEALRYLNGHPNDPCIGITFDIDDFKFINDMYGHATGDTALQQLAENMRQAFPQHALLARNGGDEFCIFLMGCTKEDADSKIRQFMLMQRSFFCGGECHHFCISAGYAVYPTQASTLDDLFRKADMALYEVKLHGKNSFLAYEPDFVPEKRSQLGFALKDVSEHLPGAFLIYKADPADDRILFANHELIQFSGCTDMDDFMNYTSQHFHNLIAPEVREATEQSIWQQISNKSYDAETYVRFPLIKKDGSSLLILDHGRIVPNSYYGNVFYVLITDAEALREHYLI